MNLIGINILFVFLLSSINSIYGDMGIDNLFAKKDFEKPIITKNENMTDKNVISVLPDRFNEISYTNITCISGLNSCYGTDADDFMTGDNGKNSMHGFSGNDIMYGNGGDDWMVGYGGDDQIEGGDGLDQIFGSQGNDMLSGGNGNNIIYGEEGNDKIYGGSDDDKLIGGNGADYIIGGWGNDIIWHYSDTWNLSHDFVKLTIPDGSKDIIDCGPGYDTVIYNTLDGDEVYDCEVKITEKFIEKPPDPARNEDCDRPEMPGC